MSDGASSEPLPTGEDCFLPAAQETDDLKDALDPQRNEYLLHRFYDNPLQHRWRIRGRAHDIQVLKDKLDKVHPCLPARLQTLALYKRATRADLGCLPRYMSLVLPRDHPEHSRPKTLDEETTAQNQRKKGLPAERLSGEVSDAIAELAACNLLAEHQGRISHYAGAFFIEKSNGLYRAITDGRPVNCAQDASLYPFSLVSNVDLRHWFHQIPLPDDVATHFVFNTHRGYYRPRAVPMGWGHAPAIAQSCTWTIVLSGALGASESRSGLTESTKKDLRSMKEPPAWVPLTGGGAIFVVLDNVCVVHAKRNVVDFWANQIKMTSEAVHAKLKDRHAKDAELDPSGPMPNTNDTPVIQLTARDKHDEMFEFLGVRWRFSWRELATEYKDMPGFRDDSWIGTHRHLASILGTLLWAFRVYQVPLYTPEMSAVRKLFAKVTPPTGDTLHSWNGRIALTNDEIACLRFWWRWRREHCQSRPEYRYINTELSTCALAATDASGKGGQGIVLYGAGPTADTIESSTTAVERIALLELRAIVRAVELLIQQGIKPSLIVLATDSLNAKSWAERGFGTCDAGNSAIQKMYEMLHENNIRLFLVYVPTQENVADEPSRGRVILTEKRQATLRYLEMARERARTSGWAHSGCLVGGMERVTLCQ